MDVHQLVMSVKDKGHIEISAKCGYAVKRKGSDPFPTEVTGWDSQVTCLACKSQE